MLKRVITTDKNIQMIQDNVDAALSPLQSSPFVGGVLLGSIALTTSQTSVPHGLGHVPKIFTLCGLNANSVVWSSKPSDTTNLYLTASAACTVSLWVS